MPRRDVTDNTAFRGFTPKQARDSLGAFLAEFATDFQKELILAMDRQPDFKLVSLRIASAYRMLVAIHIVLARFEGSWWQTGRVNIKKMPKTLEKLREMRESTEMTKIFSLAHVIANPKRYVFNMCVANKKLSLYKKSIPKYLKARKNCPIPHQRQWQDYLLYQIGRYEKQMDIILGDVEGPKRDEES